MPKTSDKAKRKAGHAAQTKHMKRVRSEAAKKKSAPKDSWRGAAADINYGSAKSDAVKAIKKTMKANQRIKNKLANNDPRLRQSPKKKTAKKKRS